MCWVPRGVEALHGRARLPCHRWITPASVVAPAAHPRAHINTLRLRPLDARNVTRIVARCSMGRTSDVPHASWHGGAPWSCPTAVPSVDHPCKRDGFKAAPTCTAHHAAYGLSMHASWLAASHCVAIVDGQDE